MTPKLQKNLYKKYPKIFRQKDLSMKETCMCWGIETGDGWYDIIDGVCEVIDNYMYNEKSRAKFEKRKPCRQIEATQVKEKFGGLRFYCSHEPDEISGAISMAERMSYKTCEDCGSTEHVTQTKGWIMTLCAKCMKKRCGSFAKIRQFCRVAFLPIKLYFWRRKWLKEEK